MYTGEGDKVDEKVSQQNQSSGLGHGELLAEEVGESSVSPGCSLQTQPWLPTPSTCALKTTLVCSATHKLYT